MVAEVFAGISSFKAMLDIAKALKDIDDAVRRNAAVIELQEKIISAEEAHSTLTNRIGELEKEVAGLKAWDAQREQHELVHIGNGCVAFMRKPQTDAPEQPAWLCATCYENRKKSYLQFQTTFNRSSIYHCPSCNSKLAVPHGTTPANFR
jgi:hypothetical protein